VRGGGSHQPLPTCTHSDHNLHTADLKLGVSANGEVCVRGPLVRVCSRASQVQKPCILHKSQGPHTHSHAARTHTHTNDHLSALHPGSWACPCTPLHLIMDPQATPLVPWTSWSGPRQSELVHVAHPHPHPPGCPRIVPCRSHRGTCHGSHTHIPCGGTSHAPTRIADPSSARDDESSGIERRCQGRPMLRACTLGTRMVVSHVYTPRVRSIGANALLSHVTRSRGRMATAAPSHVQQSRRGCWPGSHRRECLSQRPGPRSTQQSRRDVSGCGGTRRAGTSRA